jgi:hypothetical protein
MRINSTISVVTANSDHVALANGTSTSFGAGFTGAWFIITLVGETVVNAQYQYGYYDGTFNRLGALAALSVGAQQLMTATTGLNVLLSNVGTVGGFYSSSQCNFLT